MEDLQILRKHGRDRIGCNLRKRPVSFTALFICYFCVW